MSDLGFLITGATGATGVGHMSMADPALWADQAGDFVAWLSAN
jgi:hypothetical protein